MSTDTVYEERGTPVEAVRVLGTFYLFVLCQNSAVRKRWNEWRCFRFSVLTGTEEWQFITVWPHAISMEK